MKKVRIKTLPGLKKGGYPFTQMAPNYIQHDQGEKAINVRDTLNGVPRNDANIEAERNETVYIPNKEGLPAHYKIGGKRHYEGGTPLSVPPDSFVFSDTASMRIKDPDIQKEFSMPIKKKGYTPAEIAKRYDINKFREILADPTEDKLAKLTAENMIKQYNLKLGKLALIQESMKGYPGGIPIIAAPYMMSIGLSPDTVLPQVPQAQQQMQSPEEEMVEYPEMDEEELQEVPMRYGGRTARLNNFVQGIRKKNNEFDPTQGVYLYMEDGGPVFYDGNGNPAPEGIMPEEYRNGGLVEYDKGAEVKKKKQKAPPKDAVIIDRSKYDTDADYEKAKQEAYSKASDKTKVFVLDKDGVYKKVVSKAFVYPEYSGDDVDKVFNGKKDIAARYEYYKQRLSDPTVKEKLYKQYLNSFDNDKAFRSDKLKAREVSIENLKKLTPQQVVDQLLEMQKRNLAFLAHGYDVSKTPNAPDTGDPVTNKELRGYAKEVGVEMPDATNAAAQQLAYWAFEDLAGTDVLPDFTKGQRGAADEKGSKSATISPADGIYTNTTAGQLLGIKGDPTIGEDAYNEYEYEYDKDPVKDMEVPSYTPPEMFLQDKIKLAQTLGNMGSLRKFMPNKASIDLMTPDVAYLTPERQIAAGNEQLAIMKDALAASSPQQISAKMTGMSGNMFENAANIIGQVHNANIGLYNAFQQQKTGIENQERGFNAQAAKTYYDELTATNQNYNNSKRAAANEFINNLVQAKTNEAQAYNLNMLYPNYQISPAAAGALYYYKPTPMEPGAANSFADIYSRLRQDERLEELSSDEIADIAKEMAGYTKKTSSRSAKSTNDSDWYNMQRGIYGNPAMTSYPNLEEENT